MHRWSDLHRRCTNVVNGWFNSSLENDNLYIWTQNEEGTWRISQPRRDLKWFYSCNVPVKCNHGPYIGPGNSGVFDFSTHSPSKCHSYGGKIGAISEPCSDPGKKIKHSLDRLGLQLPQRWGKQKLSNWGLLNFLTFVFVFCFSISLGNLFRFDNTTWLHICFSRSSPVFFYLYHLLHCRASRHVSRTCIVTFAAPHPKQYPVIARTGWEAHYQCVF